MTEIREANGGVYDTLSRWSFYSVRISFSSFFLFFLRRCIFWDVYRLGAKTSPPACEHADENL